MEVDREETVSAEVVLRPADGRPVAGGTPITAENLADFQPSAGSAGSAAAAFKAAGFTVGPLVGIGFSITGPARLFEDYFGAALKRTDDGGLNFAGGGDESFQELPAGNVPAELRGFVEGVTFVPPPDFGPTDFMM